MNQRRFIRVTFCLAAVGVAGLLYGESVGSDASAEEYPIINDCKDIHKTSRDFRMGLIRGVYVSTQMDALAHHAGVPLPEGELTTYEQRLLGLCSLNPEISIFDAAFYAVFETTERKLHPILDEPHDGPDWTKPREKLNPTPEETK